jgi:hypothetical protein
MSDCSGGGRERAFEAADLARDHTFNSTFPTTPRPSTAA